MLLLLERAAVVPLLVVETFVAAPNPVGSAVLVGVITLPYGGVDVKPTARSAEAIEEFLQSPRGATPPGTKLIAAHYKLLVSQFYSCLSRMRSHLVEQTITSEEGHEFYSWLTYLIVDPIWCVLSDLQHNRESCPWCEPRHCGFAEKSKTILIDRRDEVNPASGVIN